MQHKRFAVTKEWKPLPNEEPLVLVPCRVAPWSLFPLSTLVDAEPISPCRADSKAVIQNYYLTVTEIVLQWDGMKWQILSVADFFASVRLLLSLQQLTKLPGTIFSISRTSHGRVHQKQIV